MTHSQTPTLDEIHAILDKALANRPTPSERLSMRGELLTASTVGLLEMNDFSNELIKEL